MPRASVNMGPPLVNPSSSSFLPADVGIDIDIDIDTFERPLPDSPMSDKATPRQQRPQQHHSDLAQSKQSNADDLANWRQEIHDRIREYPESIDDYLLDMVPSAAPPTCCPPVSMLLQAIPCNGKELEMYDPLVCHFVRSPIGILILLPGGRSSMSCRVLPIR